MKKRIIGLVVFVLLLGSSIGFAAGTSLVGAKVSGVYTIKQDGKKIADAAIINGSAYAPVRSVSEAVGVTLQVEGKKIIMGSSSTTKKTAQQYQLEFRISSLESEIKSAKGAIKGLEDSIESVNKLPSEQQKADGLAKIDEMIKAKQQVITEKEKELAVLKAQLAGLQK